MGPGRLSEREIAEAILDFRQDATFYDNYTEEDYEHMERETKKLFRAGELNDQDRYVGPGSTPDMRNYRLGCSQLNLLKLGRLRTLNRSYYHCMESIMHDREANNIDAAVGRELDDLIYWSDKGTVPAAERQRLTRLHREDAAKVWVTICKHWHRANFCKLHDDCPMWHIDAQ